MRQTVNYLDQEHLGLQGKLNWFFIAECPTNIHIHEHNRGLRWKWQLAALTTGSEGILVLHKLLKFLNRQKQTVHPIFLTY